MKTRRQMTIAYCTVHVRSLGNMSQSQRSPRTKCKPSRATMMWVHVGDRLKLLAHVYPSLPYSVPPTESRSPPEPSCSSRPPYARCERSPASMAGDSPLTAPSTTSPLASSSARRSVLGISLPYPSRDARRPTPSPAAPRTRSEATEGELGEYLVYWHVRVHDRRRDWALLQAGHQVRWPSCDRLQR